MRLYRIVSILFLLTVQAKGQYTSWREAFGDASADNLKKNSQQKIHRLIADSILFAVGSKQIVVLGDQRHSVWESFAIKNYIIQNVCKKEKINYLHEGSIYEFYYKDCKKVFLEGKKSEFAQFKDVYFGKSLGHDLLDSLSTHGTMDSITIWGVDYLTRNISELTLLYADLVNDINTYSKIATEAKIDTGFVRRMVDIEIVNHFAIENSAYNDSAKFNLSRINFFYDILIIQKGSVAEKFKKRMWQCVNQSMQYYLAQMDMNLKKAQNFDIQEMTKPGFVLRDKFLYENIRWFLTEIVDTLKRTFISIATIHAVKSMEFGDNVTEINPEYKPAGMLISLDKSFADKIYVISINPISGYDGMFGNYLSRISSFSKKSYENKILRSSENILFYNFWKIENQNEISIRPFSGKFVTKQKWNKFFDAIIFVKNVIPNMF